MGELSPVENYLEAIRFGSPDYVPRGNERISKWVSLKGNSSHSTWTDSWGVGWVMEMPDTAPFPLSVPIKYIRRIDEYALPDPDRLFDGINGQLPGIRAAKGEGLLIRCGLGYLLYERVWSLLGMEGFLSALALEPELTSELLHRIAVYNRRVFANMLEIGVDCIGFSEDLGTQRALMFSPESFRRYFLPEYEHMFQDALTEGTIIDFHSCGCVDAVAPMLASIGVTILNPVQARANDIAGIKRATYGRMALCGAVDSHLILTGTVEEIYEETRRILGIMMPGGGYVCAPDQGFPEYRPECVEAVYRAAADYGRY